MERRQAFQNIKESLCLTVSTKDNNTWKSLQPVVATLGCNGTMKSICMGWFTSRPQGDCTHSSSWFEILLVCDILHPWKSKLCASTLLQLSYGLLGLDPFTFTETCLWNYLSCLNVWMGPFGLHSYSVTETCVHRQCLHVAKRHVQ